jgi:hypothetical protein
MALSELYFHASSNQSRARQLKYFLKKPIGADIILKTIRSGFSKCDQAVPNTQIWLRLADNPQHILIEREVKLIGAEKTLWGILEQRDLWRNIDGSIKKEVEQNIFRRYYGFQHNTPFNHVVTIVTVLL